MLPLTCLGILCFHLLLLNVCNQRALACYIKKYACSNAKTEDLWAVLEEVSGEPVKELMNSWTQQKGYPVISVSVRDEKLELEQVMHFIDFLFLSGARNRILLFSTHFQSQCNIVLLIAGTLFVEWFP